MRTLILSAVAALALTSSAALAASDKAAEHRDVATVCLDPGGIKHPALCRTMSASRMPSKPDICSCPGPYRQVDAPWCARGEKPLPESAAVDRARLAAAEKDNSLFGDTYQGRRFCETVPNEK